MTARRWLALLPVVALMGFGGCGSASANHCITRHSTGQKFCGYAAVAYCNAVKPYYRDAILSGRNDVRQNAEYTWHICKERTGVDVSH